jgi:hypothetical protein
VSARVHPVSIVAERAVRYLRDADHPVASVSLARELLATRAPDEIAATRVLEEAFRGDDRLRYTSDGWIQTGAATTDSLRVPPPDPPRVLLLLEGGHPRGKREFVLRHVVAVRLDGDEVQGACGGEPRAGALADELRSTILELLDGAVPVVHDPPGALAALETWLGAPVGTPVLLRHLAHRRLGLPARHHLESLAARLGLGWRETEDRLDLAEVLDGCLAHLRTENETLTDLQRAGSKDGSVVDWSRVAFDPAFLRSVPRCPGTYRFFDERGRLLYVGKSKDLSRRVGSYFRHDAKRSVRRKEMLERLHRIEIEPTGSDLEAILREAAQIRKRTPASNVQREVHARGTHEDRLRSILILEPGIGRAVLRAYLIRSGRLVGKVSVGPRGGGLAKIERLLNDRFFGGGRDVPSPTADGPDLDVELIVRWLTSNRDRVVAFDPTDLRSASEVVERLRWFLDHGGPFEPDGSPIRTR